MREGLGVSGTSYIIVSTFSATSAALHRPATSTGGRVARDRRGNAAVEFALIAAPFVALLVAIVQTSLVFFAQQNLESTAERSVRALVTGQAQKTNMQKDDFKKLVCLNLPAFMKCTNVLIDVRETTDGFSSADTSLKISYDAGGNVSNSWKYSPGGAGTVNVVTIMYVWSVLPGPLGFDLSTMSSNRRLLYATSVFRTEPYS